AHYGVYSIAVNFVAALLSVYCSSDHRRQVPASIHLLHHARDDFLCPRHPHLRRRSRLFQVCFFLNGTAPTEIYTLSLHDALPIYEVPAGSDGKRIEGPDFHGRYAFRQEAFGKRARIPVKGKLVLVGALLRLVPIADIAARA